ncbi:MAG: hypothetical protein AAF587_37495 [Bacteroidota bacterium]
MATKRIGKGVVIFIDLEEIEPARLRSTCLNGGEVPEITYDFKFIPGDGVEVGHTVLFVEKNSTEAENVVTIPSEGGCL